MNVITMMPWCPLMEEVLGVTTKRRYFTLLHTLSGVHYFDGLDSGLLSFPSALNTYKNFPLNKSILKSLDWEGAIIKKIPHILMFDRFLERVVVANYNEAYCFLTVNNELFESQESHHDFVNSEEKAINILTHWWEDLKLAEPQLRAC